MKKSLHQFLNTNKFNLVFNVKPIMGLCLFLMFQSTFLFSQAPGGPNVDAGEDQLLDCDEVGCVELNASFFVTGEANTYDVSSISFSPPFPFTGGIPVSVNTDDVWSPSISLPFDFCFFGGTYDQMVIGSNGVISFDLAANVPSGFCPWSFNASIPSGSLISGAIFGIYMDINPAVAGSGTVNYSILGSAPTRTVVVNFPNIPYFSCTASSMTSQIVLYESTNVIEVYVGNRVSGCSWNSGNALIGIQNVGGTVGYTPPGRNTGDWNANQEAWRFTPAGASNVDFAWLDSSGTVIGTNPTIEVCPSPGDNPTYTARVTYISCNGTPIVLQDEVTVLFKDTPELPNMWNNDIIICGPFTDTTLVGTPTNITSLSSVSYSWYYNGVLNQSNTGSTFVATQPGQYTVVVDNLGCEEIGIINVTNVDLDVQLSNTVAPCDATSFEIIPGVTGAPIADVSFLWNTGETTPTITVTQGAVYSVDVTYNGCTVTESVTIEFNDTPQIGLGPDFETCFDSLVFLDATPSNANPLDATYQWFLDGNPLTETSFLLDVFTAGTYSVTVTLGICTAQDSVVIYPRSDLQVSLGSSLVQACTNDTQTLSAVTQEENVSYTWFLNGDEIPGETGSSLVYTTPGTASNLSRVYGVMITKGDCTGMAEVEVIINNCIIPQGISPDGSIGKNDYLDLEFLSNRTAIENLQIFNRLGKIVYEKTNYVNEWGGESLDGAKLPTGTYFYLINFSGTDPVFGNQTNGWIYINRGMN